MGSNDNYRDISKQYNKSYWDDLEQDARKDYTKDLENKQGGFLDHPLDYASAGFFNLFTPNYKATNGAEFSPDDVMKQMVTNEQAAKANPKKYIPSSVYENLSDEGKMPQGFNVDSIMISKKNPRHNY